MPGYLNKYANLIKAKARDLGFSGCGISAAGFLDYEARRLEAWLKSGMHGKMNYMENNFDKRVDPRKLVEGAKSVISVLHNYFTHEIQKHPEAPVLSKYAYGTDYHFVLKDKLRKLLAFMNAAIGEINGRAFVDSAPVLDRAWAARSGTGWIGKNTNLLVKGAGSFFFIGELIVDVELATDAPAKDLCGNCRLCMDSCPTGAIIGPRELDARRCISYLTVEYRDQLPAEMRDKMQNRVFGCDICQDVCPHNKEAIPHTEPMFNADPEMLEMSSEDWYEMERRLFKRHFARSAVKRAGYEQVKRNIEFLRG
jgi:epoxyqueuosine reductase